MTTEPADKLTLAHMHVQEITPAGRDPFFVVGDEMVDRDAGEPVAVGITINFHMVDGERQHGHGIALHEIPLLRRIYPGATITLLSDWVPGVDRCRAMPEGRFREEFERLRFSYNRPNQKVFDEVFGVTEAVQIKRMHEAMRDLYESWKALHAKAMEKVRKLPEFATINRATYPVYCARFITSADLDTLVKRIEPSVSGLESVRLDPIDLGESTAAFTGKPEEHGDDHAALRSAFEKAGFSDTQADELAAIGLGAAVEEITDDLLAQVTGLAKDGVLDAKLAKRARQVLAAKAKAKA